jgi:hypothetical protein
MGFTDLLTDAGLAGMFPRRQLRAPPVATPANNGNAQC